jgi:group I intron endonuclease
MTDVVWSIYRITNVLNNKIYIGQTKDPKTRWSRHKSDARLGKKYNWHLYDAMRKYGVDNFVFEVIAQTKFLEEVDRLEILLIEQYGSTDKNIGYNISAGGQANKLVSSETRKKMSEAAIGREAWNKNKPCSEETKKLLSQANKGNKFRLGVKVSEKTKILLSQINIGKKATLETKHKMSQSMIGKNAGEKNGMFGKTSAIAKLTMEQASEIRREYKAGGITLIILAVKYGVSKRTILNIVHNKIYKE